MSIQKGSNKPQQPPPKTTTKMTTIMFKNIVLLMILVGCECFVYNLPKNANLAKVSPLPQLGRLSRGGINLHHGPFSLRPLMLSKDESQIDAFRRDNRPSTAPLTINLIKRCLKGRGGRKELELLEYVAEEVQGGLEKEKKRAEDDLVDGVRVGLTGREECGVMGR